mmetsp:Transcript_15970/g.45757  ORF Transcript_15970/g.45757 Transcript_15970/m.45757 type:complete len:167 (+) Transcript_15970:120-620(+)
MACEGCGEIAIESPALQDVRFALTVLAAVAGPTLIFECGLFCVRRWLGGAVGRAFASLRTRRWRAHIAERWPAVPCIPDDDGHGDDCAVCLSRTAPPQLCRTLACGHRFHAECIDSWWAMQLSNHSLPACPLCRLPIAGAQKSPVDGAWRRRCLRRRQRSVGATHF